MKMDLKDKGILAPLGFDEHGDGSWRVLRRGGHILLLVPDFAASVSKGLQLYRPQRLLARLFVGGVSRLPFGRLFLKRIKGSILSGAAIQTCLIQQKPPWFVFYLETPLKRNGESSSLLKLEPEIILLSSWVGVCSRGREDISGAKISGNECWKKCGHPFAN